MAACRRGQAGHNYQSVPVGRVLKVHPCLPILSREWYTRPGARSKAYWRRLAYQAREGCLPNQGQPHTTEQGQAREARATHDSIGLSLTTRGAFRRRAAEAEVPKEA